MKIKHYLYNAFLVEDGDKKIAIDPGGLFLYYFRLTTLIPKSEWAGVTSLSSWRRIQAVVNWRRVTGYLTRWAATRRRLA